MYDVLVVVAVLTLIGSGVLLIIRGAQIERQRIRAHAFDAKTIADIPQPITFKPEAISEKELRALGWKPCNDGTGLWKCEL